MKNILVKVFMTFSFCAMVLVNYLANALPIGGITTGEASDLYFNLFTPVGLTFSIWGVIYALLLVYVIYSWGLFRKNTKNITESLIRKVDLLFIVNAVLNISWIFAWHYQIIPLSLVIMFGILGSLVALSSLVNRQGLSLRDHICLRLPFSIYFGWISVATIANLTVLMVTLDWANGLISEVIWTMAVLVIGMVLGIWRAFSDKNIPYLLVFVWAYSGIVLRHQSVEGLNGQYPQILTTLWICLGCILFSVGMLLFLKAKKRAA